MISQCRFEINQCEVRGCLEHSLSIMNNERLIYEDCQKKLSSQDLVEPFKDQLKRSASFIGLKQTTTRVDQKFHYSMIISNLDKLQLFTLVYFRKMSLKTKPSVLYSLATNSLHL